MIKQNFYYPKYDQYYDNKKFNFLPYLNKVDLILTNGLS